MGSLLKDSFWVAINRVVGIVFPLLSYTYVSRKLGVEALGAYNFVNSIVTYFILIAGLGIVSYAIREGMHKKTEPSAFEQFACEIFSINIVATILAVVVYLLGIATFSYSDKYFWLFIISVAIIIEVPFEMEWYFSIYQNFRVIAIRNLCIRAGSLCAVWLFVNESNDIYIYATIMATSAIAVALYNYWYVNRRLNLTFKLSAVAIKQHIDSVLVMFFITIAVSVYTTSDITLLGIYCGDFEVGIYSNAAKIYSIVDSLIASIAVAAYPYIVAKNTNPSDSKAAAAKVFAVAWMVVIPVAIHLSCLSSEIIAVASGDSFLVGSSILSVLSLALVFNIVNWVWTRCIIFPNKMERKMLIIAIVAGMINVVANVFVVPKWGGEGAAITTVIAEVVTALLYAYIGKAFIARIDVKTIMNPVLGGIWIIIINRILHEVIQNTVCLIVLSSILSYAGYIFTMCFLDSWVKLELAKLIKWRHNHNG